MPISDTEPDIPWYAASATRDEVLAFAHILEDADYFPTPSDVLDYFEKPWKWREEHALWTRQGRPTVDVEDRWGAFVEALANREEST